MEQSGESHKSDAQSTVQSPPAASIELRFNNRRLWPSKSETDCTFYAALRPKALAALDTQLRLSRDGSWQGTVYLVYKTSDEAHKARHGRGLVCTCTCPRGRYFSITVRVQGELDSLPPDSGSAQARRPQLVASGQRGGTPSPAATHPYELDPNYDGKASSRVLREVADCLYRRILESGPHHGVVVITGATKSNKSVIARHLLFRYLADLKVQQRDERRPHLLTIEDPIERDFHEQPWAKLNDGSRVDYTARTIPQDAPGVRSALADALRQTPKAVYVGEVRSDEDWRSVMLFAGTGHLILTTAHAGSLVEAIGRILRAVQAETPAQRGEYAQRILAVAHVLPSDKFLYENQSCSARLPAVWVRTAAGIDGLVADGLASILPHNIVSAPGQPQRRSSLGRLFFARELGAKLGLEPTESTKLEAWARHRDLEGK